jgi:hypothetical protein
LHIVAVLLCALAAICHAGIITITFDEPGVESFFDSGYVSGTTDPGYNLDPLTFAGTQSGDLWFSAGDPLALEDTWVDTPQPPIDYDGNALANGYVGVSAAIILGVADPSRLVIKSVSAPFQMLAIQNSWLYLDGYWNGVMVASASVEWIDTSLPWTSSISLSAPPGVPYLDHVVFHCGET